MMYGGRIIILGESGERVGEDMAAGDIFVGGAVRSLGSDAQLTDIDSAEIDDIRAFLDRHEIAYKGGFQKVVNAGKRLRYATSEQQVRSIPFFTFSGTSDYWNPKVQEDVYVKAQIGRYRVRGYGGARTLPHLSDLAFKRDLSGAGAAGDPVAAVEMRTEIGGLNGARSLKLSMPVMIAPMSYGALSRSTKQGGGHGVEHGGHCREHRRRWHERRPAGRGGAAGVPVPGRPARLEHPRHEPGGRA